MKTFFLVLIALSTSFNVSGSHGSSTGGKAGSAHGAGRVSQAGPAANQFFASPTGTSAGNGSMASPWDLKTALSHPAVVKPGDTIYLRGGTYNVPPADLGFTSRLAGTATSPIKVMSYPGEWAVIDGNVSFSAVKSKTLFLIAGSCTWFMNFEITNSETGNRKIDVSGSGPAERRADAIVDAADGTKLINLVIHDTGQGFLASNDFGGNEYYGNVIYNNGWDAPDRTHGHGAYIQSKNGPKMLEDNFFFNNFSMNSQMYGSDSTANRGISWIGNTFFNGNQAWWGPNITDLTVKENCTYNQVFKVGQNLDISNTNADIENNYFMSGVFIDELTQGVVFKNNTVWRETNDPTVFLQVRNFWAPAKFTIDNNIYYKSPTSPNNGQMRILYSGSKQWLPIIKRFSGSFAFNRVTGSQATTYSFTKKSWQDDFHFDTNTTYTDSAPTGIKVFVRRNKYDPGRANIVVYNWDMAGTVDVDVSSVLSPGDGYELRNVQDYFGDVLAGVYGGGRLTVSMTGRTMAKPIGYDQVTSWYHNPLKQNTFPKFGAFVLIKKSTP